MSIFTRATVFGNVLLAVTAADATKVLGDTITLKSAGANTAGLTYADAHVQRIEGDQLFYTMSTGQERNRDIASIASMRLDDEKAFSAADVAYAQQHWDDAVKGYTDAIQHTSKSWLRQYIAPRLLDAGNQAHRFDAAVAGWLELVRNDVAAANKVRPAIPQDAASTAMSAGATQLEEAAGHASGEARQAILSYLLAVDNARKDTAGAQRVAKSLNGGSVAVNPDASAQSMAADTQLALAKNALDIGEPDKAVATVEAAGSLLLSANQQAQGLFILAQAKEAKTAKDHVGDDATAAPATAPANDDWKDVILAYMRVYAHFHQNAGSSDLAMQSLVKAAQLEEKRLNEPAVALTLYQKLASDYKDTPAGDRAAADAARLGRQGVK